MNWLRFEFEGERGREEDVGRVDSRIRRPRGERGKSKPVFQLNGERTVSVDARDEGAVSLLR